MKYKKSLLGGTIAFLLASSCCWLPALLIALGAGSSLLALGEGLGKLSGIFLAVGLAFLGYGFYQFRFKKTISGTAILQSTIRCPECGFEKEETMPTDACQFFYECENCHSMLKPKKDDCCVFCSYGTVACPPIQLNQDCC